MSLLIYPPGMQIVTIVGGIEGQITSVNLKFELVTYEVVIWNAVEGTFNTTWLHESEFTAKGKRRAIGYKV